MTFIHNNLSATPLPETVQSQIDSKMILQFAQQKQLRLCEKVEKVQAEITSLMDRKHQLIKLLTSEKKTLG